ncbi:Uncharacterised protein [Yersinia enterocolitica]|nr:Uncharacterised protein [Yersinia enterocolitica]
MAVMAFIGQIDQLGGQCQRQPLTSHLLTDGHAFDNIARNTTTGHQLFITAYGNKHLNSGIYIQIICTQEACYFCNLLMV